MLSSMPTPYDVTQGQRLTRAIAEATRRQQRVGAELVLEVEPPPPSVRDAWVHVALGEDGSVVSTKLGPAAVVILP